MVRLTNTEKYAIQGMIHSGLDARVIARNLKKSVDVIDSYIDGLTSSLQRLADNGVPVEQEPVAEPVAEAIVEEAPVDPTLPVITPEIQELIPAVEPQQPSVHNPRGLTKSLMINKTAAKKIKGVAIMTEAASAVSDELAKQVPTTKSRTSKGAIHLIEENKLRD